MKVGILGGTFDPIHLAHEKLGHTACRQFGLDYILVMPTGNSYLKTIHGQVTSARHREAMVKLSIADDPCFRYSDMEILRPGYTYTADTLLQLSHSEPGTEWYFIIGADSLHGLKDWFAPEVICRHAVLLVAGRRDQVNSDIMREDINFLKNRYEARIELLETEDMDISSSVIRREIREGKLPHPCLEPAVNDYIREHGLYGKPRTEAEILKSLSKRLKKSRYIHTLGVAETAWELAKHYGADPHLARLAGILHDCGKSEGDALTHAPLGAVIAREEYGIDNQEVLSAIRWHTTGRPGMTLLEKIIFTADYIEPGRDKAPHLKKLRKLAYKDLDKTIVCILDDTLSYLRKSGADIDGQSMETYNYYNNLAKNSRKDKVDE